MLKPLGDNHSNRKMVKVAAWMATKPTSIQEAASKGSRKAVGDMIPVRFATTMAIPVSIKGTLKSTWKTTKTWSLFRWQTNAELIFVIFTGKKVIIEWKLELLLVQGKIHVVWLFRRKSTKNSGNLPRPNAFPGCLTCKVLAGFSAAVAKIKLNFPQQISFG